MRILLADDHEEFLDEFAALLAGRHEIVGSARNGEELVRLASSCRPDVILADINMPLMNGMAAIRKIIEQPGTPEAIPPKAIFVTTHSSPQYIRHALEMGASGFVHKFYAFEQIEEAIEATRAGRIYLSPQLNFPSSPAASPDTAPDAD